MIDKKSYENIVVHNIIRQHYYNNRIRYLKGVKSGITYVISHNYAKIKVDLCDSLPPEKNNDFS